MYVQNTKVLNDIAETPYGQSIPVSWDDADGSIVRTMKHFSAQTGLKIKCVTIRIRIPTLA